MPSSVLGPLISEMTKGVRLASPIIESLANIGPGSPLTELQRSIPGVNLDNPARLSANRIIQLVKDAGYKVQRQEALKLIRHIREQAPKRAYMKSVPNGLLPDPGETTSLFRTVSTNSVLTKNQVYDLLSGLFEDTPSNYPYEVLSMVAEEGFINPGGVLPQ